MKREIVIDYATRKGYDLALVTAQMTQIFDRAEELANGQDINDHDIAPFYLFKALHQIITDEAPSS